MEGLAVKATEKKALKPKTGGMKMDWLAFALAAMVLFSISNLALKLFVSNPAFAKIDFAQFLVPAALIALGILAALFLAYQNLQSQLFYYAIAVLVLTALGFGAFVLALRTGKVAVITAVLSISTITVAVLSYFFLGDRFSLKETLAMAFAVISILVLVL